MLRLYRLCTCCSLFVLLLLGLERGRLQSPRSMAGVQAHSFLQQWARC